MHPKQISINDFTYILPEEKIAKYPLAQRDSSKLLIYQDGQIVEDIYANLPKHLPTDATLVFNNTKVVEARLHFEKETGTIIELFCLEPADSYPDITTAMLQKGTVLWKCLIGGAKKWKSGCLKKVFPNNAQQYLHVQKLERINDYFLVAFSWDDKSLSFAEVLHLVGQIPLPPYLHRDVKEADKATYQTVYAKHDGSVAAPTAGLHFTESLLQNLYSKHINSSFVTLHVGAGTFKPVKTDTMSEHEMHAEYLDVTLSFIENLIIQLTNKVIAVGTTSLRTIESLYWMGVKVLAEKEDYSFVSQWEAYELPQHYTAKEALTALQQQLIKENKDRLLTQTQIIIAPGYELRVADAIITNFHQPKSTLLLLIAAIVGDDWHKIYDYALLHNFRFLSYGDGSLLWKRKKS